MNDNKDKLHEVSIRNHKKIKNALQPLFEQFGVNYFYYCRISNSGIYSSFSSNVEWNKWWFEEKIHQELFYFLQPQNYPIGMTISLPFFEEKFKKTQKIATDKFFINYVLEITYKYQEGLESYGFSSEVFHSNTLTYYLTHLPLLQLFFKYFREKNRDIFKQLNENPFDLAKEIGPAFFKSSSSINKPYSHFNFLKNIGMEIFSDLSRREKQICENITQGLSANDIAITLNLSKRTVEYYIDNIKVKLNCFSKSDLVKKCLELYSIGYL